MSKKPDLNALFGSKETSTFLGLDSCDDLDQLESPVALIGASTATPYRSVGAYCRNGPKAIRQGVAAFAANLDHYDFDGDGRIFPDQALTAVDCGDLDLGTATRNGGQASNRPAMSTIAPIRGPAFGLSGSHGS